MRLVVGAKRPIPRGGLAHGLYRTDQHQPPAASRGHRPGERGNGRGLGGEHRWIGAGMGALGEVDDGVDAIKRGRPIGRRTDIPEN